MLKDGSIKEKLLLTTQKSDIRPPNNGENVVGQFLLGKTLGQGTFGKVRLGTHIITGEKVK